MKLREVHTDQELEKVYGDGQGFREKGFDFTYRMNVLSSAVRLCLDRFTIESIADLACADCLPIASSIVVGQELPALHLGDFAKVNVANAKQLFKQYKSLTYYHGRIEDTVDEIPKVDLFILNEILELVSEPEKVLSKIKTRARYVVVLTPCNEKKREDGFNNCWSWNYDDFKKMLVRANFIPMMGQLIQFDFDTIFKNNYQLWILS